MKFSLPLILPLILFAGCARTYQVTSSANAKVLLEGESGTVQLGDSARYEGKDFAVTGDSLHFLEKRTKEAKAAALQDVIKIEKRNHFAGAMQGAFFSALALGLESGYLEDPYEDHSLAFGATAMLGVAATIVSSAIGEKVTYDMRTNPARPVMPSGLYDGDDLVIRKSVVAGIESNSFISKKSGSFKVQPGYTIGYRTGLPIARSERGAFGLGVDVVHSQFFEYTRQTSFYWSSRYRYRTVSDLRYDFSMIELGGYPEYMIELGGGYAACFYAGGSVGFGHKGLRRTDVSSTVVDSTVYSSFDIGLSDNRPSPGVSSLTAGASLYYNHIMFDLRWKRSSLTDAGNVNNIYLQLGVVF